MYNTSCIEYKRMIPGSNTCLSLRKGAWTAQEDRLLKNCIEKYGEGKWHLVPIKTGLNRCRKSCRLRWLNYLSPNIKRGDFREDEVDLMLRLHKLLGNRWSLIAGRIPGRTANDVKNYWNTHIRSRSTKQKGKPNRDEPPQDTTAVPIIKPQPSTFSKNLNGFMMSTQDQNNNAGHGNDNLLRTPNHDVGKSFNMSQTLIPSPGLLNENITEYWDEIFDKHEKQTETEVGWPFGVERHEVLDIVDQESQYSLLDFHMDEDLLYSQL